MKAILYDATRCIGCRGCQVACKQWNELPAEQTKFFAAKGYQNPLDLSAKTWTLITYNEVRIAERFDWVFGKLQCMHCNEPACVDSCPAMALEKLPEGPVAYHPERCLGCRYCMLACPFQVPRFAWHSAVPVIAKCTMCAERVKAGLEPSCVKTCPTDALVFGEREDLIREAQDRIHRNPSGYVHHIYGKDEVGGTCVLHISNVPLETVGYRTDLPLEPLRTHSAPAMRPIPGIVLSLSFALGAVSWIVNRRIEMNNKEAETPLEKGGAEA